MLLFALAAYTLGDIFAAIQEIGSLQGEDVDKLNLPKPWELVYSLASLCVLVVLRVALCKALFRPIGALLIPRVSKSSSFGIRVSNGYLFFVFLADKGSRVAANHSALITPKNPRLAHARSHPYLRSC